MRIGTGIEIGSRTLRLVELELARTGPKLINWGVVAVPEGTTQGGAITNPAAIAPFLERLVGESRRRKLHGPARVALPEQQTFLKLIGVPVDRDGSLADAVRFEAGQHIPFAPEEIVLDWHEMARAKGTATVLVAAAPRALVEGTVAALDAAGIPVELLEIESLATARALLEPSARRSSAPRILADLGDQRTTLVVYDRGAVPFTATLPFAQSALTRRLSADLGISPEDAEKAKRLFGLDPHRGKGVVRTTILPLLQELVEGVQRTATYYAEHDPLGRPVEVLLLTGGGSLLPGIAPFLGHALKLRTRAAELPASLHQLGPSYATAVGLALATP